MRHGAIRACLFATVFSDVWEIAFTIWTRPLVLKSLVGASLFRTHALAVVGTRVWADLYTTIWPITVRWAHTSAVDTLADEESVSIITVAHVGAALDLAGWAVPVAHAFACAILLAIPMASAHRRRRAEGGRTVHASTDAGRCTCGECNCTVKRRAGVGGVFDACFQCAVNSGGARA